MAKTKLAVVSSEEVNPLAEINQAAQDVIVEYFGHKKIKVAVRADGFDVDFKKSVSQIGIDPSMSNKRVRKPKLIYNVKFEALEGKIKVTAARGVRTTIGEVKEVSAKKDYASALKSLAMEILKDAGEQVKIYQSSAHESLLQKINDLYEAGELEGFYTEFPDEVYHQSPGLSNSLIAPAKLSYNHYEYNLNEEKESTSSMKFGTLAHLKVLEPKKFKDKVVVMDLNRATTEGKILDAHNNIINAHRLVTSTKDYNNVLAAEINLSKHPVLVPLMREGLKEVAVFYKKDGQLRRGKIDGLIPEPSKELAKLLSSVIPYSEKEILDSAIVYDVKSTRSIEPSEFSREIDKRGYHVQMGGYAEGVKTILGRPVIVIFVLLENVAPFQWDFQVLDPSDVDAGVKEYDRLVAKILDHEKNEQKWRGMPLQKKTFISRPNYAISRDEDRDDE